MDYRDELDRILGARRLQPLFQPIVSLRARRIMGYEGLIRGPSDSPLHAPAPLFEAARRSGQLFELDLLCRQVLIKAFVRRGLQGRLFLNVNPLAMGDPRAVQGETLKALHRMGLSPEQVVIELTEQQPIDDYDLMRRAVAHYRRMGFSIALDDLGAGYSSFRHWSELKPDFVKIDMRFVQNAHNDPAKREFIRSFREISHTLGARLIAEGIEVHEEFEIIRGLDVEYGQGYYFGRPNADPPRSLDEIMDATQMD
ncbi:MAG: EAL domain-containing protein, partial [Chromatiales bacterium]|nr:EAL domain-containing protein [Chromatiales bacterium]